MRKIPLGGCFPAAFVRQPAPSVAFVKIAEVAFALPLHQTYHYLLPTGSDAETGSRVRAPFGSRRLVGTVLRIFDATPERPLKTIEAVIDPKPVLPAELAGLAQWLSSHYGAPLGECLRAVSPSFVKTRAEAGAAPELAAVAPQGSPRPAFELTAAQSQALARLSRMLASGRHHAALLYGVPASGKTEVYLRLIRQAVMGGGQALFLLPEISLTLPFYDDFIRALGVPVGLWHSRMGLRDKRKAWSALASGEMPVVVGARSAALLPFKNLRLAVLDEEQDPSYKEDGRAPFYHARDVAAERARRSGALLVLGSATPSLEAWSMAAENKAELVALPDRVSSLPRPSVRLIAPPPPQEGRVLSEEILDLLKAALQRREQAILLLNRRGFNTLLLCRRCGWVDRCPHCGVAKIRHRSEKGFSLICHHCGRSYDVPFACGQCRSPSLAATGAGTQKVAEDLKARLPGARVLRLDRDTLDGKGLKESRVYEKFLRLDADILVGTQLVAKSFHFPRVTLVGVVDADAMLQMPDFRASERAAQLLCQAAGRSGRAELPGLVAVQTRLPESPALRAALSADYAAFAERELEVRRELGYPPAGGLVRVVLSGPEEGPLWEAARSAVQKIREGLPELPVVGPAPAVVRLESKRPRIHFLVKIPRGFDSQRLFLLLRAIKTPSGLRRRVDVDPYDLF